VTADRLVGRAALSLGARRLDGDFFDTAVARDASQFALTASLGADTEVYRFHPLDKRDARLAASLVLLRRDQTDALAADWLTTGEFTASTAVAWSPHSHHTLAGELVGSLVVGDIDSRAQLLSAGGAAGLRGFGPAAVFGRALGSARGEWRHTFVSDLDWNFGQYSFVRALGGAAFADVGVVSACDGYQADDAAVYSSVGYGLTALYDNFGTLPALMRIDGALRMTGQGADCLGQPAVSGPAVQIYVSFVPPF